MAAEAPADYLLELDKQAFTLKQDIERKELKIKHLTAEVEEHKVQLKSVTKEIDLARDMTTKSWERTGYGTLKYTDLKPTGLSKRTASGGHFTS